ncbi:toxin glutamine deamidase domain-containing protein [Actinomadura luteofluorescens]|uniref:toxin glutamine deamidase domain-containing protein n=1 Tax=Actinomadura luteofluorescens TaxID=46163 RepID=UPI0030D5D14E
MGIEQSSGTDTRVEGTDKPPGQDRPPAPPPDRPGQPGYPSRLESLRTAREAQLARAAEMESRQPASPENGTEQPDDGEGEGSESSRDEQQVAGEAETADERRGSRAENGEPDGEPDAEQPEDVQVGETEVTTRDSAPLAESKAAEDIDSSSAEQRNAQGEAEDASRSAPENSEDPRPDGAEEQAGTADTDEATGEPNGEPLEGGQADAPEPSSVEPVVEDPAPLAETEATEGHGDPREAEAGRTQSPPENSDERRVLDATEGAPPSSDALNPPETRDSLQEGRPPGTNAPVPEAATEQILHDAPAPNPALESDDFSATGKTVEGDLQRSTDGRFASTEIPEQSDVLDNSAISPQATEEGDPSRRPSPQIGEIELGSQGEHRDNRAEAQSDSPAAVAGTKSEIERQMDIGAKLAQLADKKVDTEIDQTLNKVNPKYDMASSAYSENCTGVVQANELRRRGQEVAAGPLEKHLRSDQNGPGGRDLSDIEQAWGGTFTYGTKSEIEEAFKQPGSRGIVYIAWNGVNTGAHVFSVENVGGRVRFVDSQPKPPVRDAAYYFTIGHSTKYLRVDDLPTPAGNKTDPFLEP